MRTSTIFVLCVLVTAALAAGADTGFKVNLYPADATYVSADEPDMNFDRSPLGMRSSPQHLTYLRFNLAPIRGHKVSSAILHLYQTDAEHKQNGSSEVRWADNDWNGTAEGLGDELTLTYSNRPQDQPMEHPVLRTTYESTISDFPWDITHYVHRVLSGDRGKTRRLLVTLVVRLSAGEARWEDDENTLRTGNRPGLELILDGDDPILPGMGDLPFRDGYRWTVDATHGLRRDGKPFYMRGVGLSTGTTICGRYELYRILDQLHEAGFNVIRLYAPPSDTYSCDTAIAVCEQWNADHPDGGDPNRAIHYMIEFKPRLKDGSMPDLDDPESIRQALHGDHPQSLKSMIQSVNHHRPRHLLAYIFGHEFTFSGGINAWLRKYQYQKVADFFQLTGDAIRKQYAPGILMSHECDGRVAYDRFEALDDIPGNTLAGCDMLGWNWYPDTQKLMSGEIEPMLKKWRDMSGSRGWYIGETSPTTDVNCPRWSARNYTQPQACANIEAFYRLCRKVGGNIGFNLFKSTDDGNTAVGKQRGVFDWYLSPKMRYFMHDQIMLLSNPGDRSFENDQCCISGEVTTKGKAYHISWSARNKTDKRLFIRLEKLGAADTPQYFEPVEDAHDIPVEPGQTVKGSFALDASAHTGEYVISLRMMSDINPPNAYLNGRDGLCVGATLLWTRLR